MLKNPAYGTTVGPARLVAIALFAYNHRSVVLRSRARRMNENSTRFAFRVERWEKGAVDHVAGVEDFLLAMATYQAACRRWPDARITLRQDGRIIEDSRENGRT